MRILIVIPTLGGGGAERVGAIISQSLQKMGMDIVVLALGHTESEFEWGGKVERLELGATKAVISKTMRIYSRAKAICRITEKYQPDIVLASTESSIYSCALASLSGHWKGKLIAWIHDTPARLGGGQRQLLRMALSRCQHVIVPAKGLCAELIRLLHLKSTYAVAAIANPVAPEFFSKGVDNQGPLAYQDHLLFMGRLEWYKKGLDILVAAYAQLEEPRPKLVIVGSGPDEQRLKAEMQRYGVADSVFFMGWQAKPQLFVEGAAAFVMSSRYESWGNVLLEAMAAGCPVAATACPFGPAEILGEDLKCFLAPNESAIELAKVLKSLLNMPVAEKLALKNKLVARAHSFSADRVGLRWQEFLNSIERSSDES